MEGVGTRKKCLGEEKSGFRLQATGHRNSEFPLPRPDTLVPGPYFYSTGH